jgi:hypothetical protein
MSKNNQQNGKQVHPAAQSTAPASVPAADAPQEPAAPTTIKLKGPTKTRLDTLKEVMKVGDYDAVVNRLIDNLPAKLSTETEVHLVMTKSKYTWLMAKQDTCDCRTCLNDSRV